MVLQPRPSAPRRQIRASYKSKRKFVRQELGNPKEIVLEEGVWSRGLPDDIFCTILACLPLSSFSRLRRVCRKWSLIDQDLIFTNAYTRVSSQEPCLFLGSRDSTSWIYEHGLNSWKCIPHSFFCPKGLEGKWSPIGAVGSRLLLTNNSKCLYDRDYSFKVYNPLSGTQQTLPPMLAVNQRHHGRYGLLDTNCEVRVIGILEDPKENYYRILVMDRKTSTSDDPEDYYEDNNFDPWQFSTLHAQVYDSRLSEWDLKEISDEIYRQVLNVALFGDALQYLITVEQGYFRDHQIMGDLVIYSLSGTQDDCGAYEWDFEGKLILNVPKGDIKLRIVTAHIFVIRGRLMLAAAVPLQTTHNRFRKWKSIIIWELLELGGKWVRTTEIDLRELDPSLSEGTLDSFFFLSNRDSLYFGSNTGKFVGIINIPKKTWSLFPPCPGFLPHLGIPAATEARFMTFIYQPGF